MMKGNIAPTNSPAKMIGLVSDIRFSELWPSRLAFLRNPPKRVRPTKAEHPKLTERLTEAAVNPEFSSKVEVSFSSSPRLATLTDVEALTATGERV